jgi:hypothetical protein
LLTEKGRALLLLVTRSLSTIEPDRKNAPLPFSDLDLPT